MRGRLHRRDEDTWQYTPGSGGGSMQKDKKQIDLHEIGKKEDIHENKI